MEQTNTQSSQAPEKGSSGYWGSLPKMSFLVVAFFTGLITACILYAILPKGGDIINGISLFTAMAAGIYYGNKQNIFDNKPSSDQHTPYFNESFEPKKGRIFSFATSPNTQDHLAQQTFYSDTSPNIPIHEGISDHHDHHFPQVSQTNFIEPIKEFNMFDPTTPEFVTLGPGAMNSPFNANSHDDFP